MEISTSFDLELSAPTEKELLEKLRLAKAELNKKGVEHRVTLPPTVYQPVKKKDRTPFNTVWRATILVKGKS